MAGDKARGGARKGARARARARARQGLAREMVGLLALPPNPNPNPNASPNPNPNPNPNPYHNPNHNDNPNPNPNPNLNPNPNPNPSAILGLRALPPRTSRRSRAPARGPFPRGRGTRPRPPARGSRLGLRRRPWYLVKAFSQARNEEEARIDFPSSLCLAAVTPGLAGG